MVMGSEGGPGHCSGLSSVQQSPRAVWWQGDSWGDVASVQPGPDTQRKQTPRQGIISRHFWAHSPQAPESHSSHARAYLPPSREHRGYRKLLLFVGLHSSGLTIISEQGRHFGAWHLSLCPSLPLPVHAHRAQNSSDTLWRAVLFEFSQQNTHWDLVFILSSLEGKTHPSAELPSDLLVFPDGKRFPGRSSSPLWQPVCLSWFQHTRSNTSAFLIPGRLSRHPTSLSPWNCPQTSKGTGRGPAVLEGAAGQRVS